MWKMIEEITKTTDTKSPKEVAKKFPKLMSLLFEQGMGIPESTAMPMITAWADSPLNADEDFNFSHTMINRFGMGEVTGTQAAEEATSYFQKATAAMTPPETGTTEAAAQNPPTPSPPATPVVTKVETPKTGTPNLNLLGQYKNEVRGLVGENTAYQVRYGEFPKNNPFPITQALALAGSAKYKNDPEVQALAKDALSGNSPLKQFIADAGPASFAATKDLPSEGTGIPPEAAPTPEAKQAGIDYLTRPVTSKPPYTTKPTPAAKPASPEVTSTMDDLLSSVMQSQGAGQVALKKRKFEKAMTLDLAAQMQSNPEGIKLLVDRSEAMLNDPGTIQAMALIQNAPAVYESNLRSSGAGMGSKLDIANKLLDLGIKQLTLKTAELNFRKAGIEGQLDQYKLMQATVLMKMLESGTVVLPEVASQVMKVQDEYMKAGDEAEKAKAANKPGEMDTALKVKDQKKKQYATMMLAAANSVGAMNTPQAKAMQKLLESSSKWEPSWFLFIKRGLAAGNIVETQTGVADTKPTMTSAGAAFDAEVNK
jgi:hypothetical protein